MKEFRFFAQYRDFVFVSTNCRLSASCLRESTDRRRCVSRCDPRARGKTVGPRGRFTRFRKGLRERRGLHGRQDLRGLRRTSGPQSNGFDAPRESSDFRPAE